MPGSGATLDENDRPPLDKGGLQGGSIRSSENLPLTPSLCKEGGLFSRGAFRDFDGNRRQHW